MPAHAPAASLPITESSPSFPSKSFWKFKIKTDYINVFIVRLAKFAHWI